MTARLALFRLGSQDFPMRHSLVVGNGSWMRLRRRIYAVALLCFFAPGIWAASAPDASIASKYVRTDFAVDDGLPDGTVNAITQTDNGLLWVGTESGLASFDGRTFTPVRLRIPGALPPSTVSSLVEGADGDLWVGTDAGIVRIPKNDLNASDFPDSAAFRLGEQQSDEVEVLFMARDRTIWAGTDHGLYRFDGNRFVREISSLYIGRISQGLHGELILNTEKGFAEFDGKRMISHPGFGSHFGVADKLIFDTYQDAEGTYWYCTEAGLRAIKERNPVAIHPYELAHVPAYRMFAGADGALWLNTKIGIYLISGQHLWAPAPNLHGRSFYAGKEGDLWIGTNGNGLVHLQPRIVQTYTKADGLQTDIVMSVLAAHDGRLWVGSNCGLAVFDGNRFKTFDEKDHLANTCVWSLAEDREHNMWIGTYGGGVFRYRNGAFTQYTLGEQEGSNIALDVEVAQDDSLWIATPDGVSHLQNGKIRNYTTKDGLSSARVLAIHQDRDGTIWAATQAGVERLVSNRFVPLPAAQSFDEVLVRRLVEDSRGNLYTTNMPQGLSQIKNGQLTLLDNSLNLIDMVEASDHTLWFSSINGVIRIAEQELARAGNSDVPLNYEVFNRTDGLNTTEASVGAPNVAMMPDGRLWIATVKGLAMIDTRHLPVTGRTPKIFISGVSSDGRSNRVNDRLFLRPGMHHLELHIDAISLANPQKIRLQYLMKGVDSDWLDATNSRTAVYTNIPAGVHPFMVRATDSMGRWQAPQVVYEVTQEPHFYATPLFQISAIAALVLLLVLAYLVRVKYLVKQARVILLQRQVEREAVARDLHDTFLQGVQGLILRFHTGTQQLPPESSIREGFEQALSQADRVMIEGRGVLSRLRSRGTKPESLTESYTAIGKELRAVSPAHLEVSLGGASRDLDAVVQEEVLKIGREALFNAYRHARARRIEVEIYFGIFEFRIRFRDDGVGINPAILREGSVPGHFGLPGMRERVSRIGGHMELWSRRGAGTEVEVRVPSVIAYRCTEKQAPLRWIRRLLRSRAVA
jgi:ligand-binding sensor domain-containing protein/signal transduction histidine kinase